MKAQERLLIVSNRLPVTLSTEEGRLAGRPASGGLVNALSPALKNKGGVWAGWPGTLEDTPPAALGGILRRVSAESGYRLLPVNLTSEDLDSFYSGFSNSVLWPLFHDLQGRCDFNPSFWDGYMAANEKFAKVLLRHMKEGDYVWVNDYHLIPLGRMLREKRPGLKVSFFLHIPFPSVDIFMKMPQRRHILSQLTSYSFVGFQTMRDRRNFIDCLKVFYPEMKVSGRGNVVRVRKKDEAFLVGAVPISIDFRSFSALASSKSVIARSREIQKEITADRYLLGVDRLDYSKGIPERLRGFQRFLQLNPEHRERVSMMQVVVPSRETVGEYLDLKQEIELLISRINGEYSTTRWVPVHWRYGSVSREELAALYRGADMALVTSLKDGMNLVCKEYCACKTDARGVLILSEFAGAAIQLAKGALLVNPYDVDAVASAIAEGLSMVEQERRRRMRWLRKTIARNDVFRWVDDFLRASVGKKLAEFPEEEVPALWPGLEGDEA
ncbi:MAG: trehalose-6-phosphate synthase [Synergistota bacterium]|jgi:trehalose 6-phosphate synthase|nr:trehalose-6-phosphate synthase [Synergistota bacterium]OPZ34259.1 MAG: Trehalose-phosphate synthase [Synergistetes bacterium ADurb.BinA166]